MGKQKHKPSTTRRRRIDPKTLLKYDYERLSTSRYNCPIGYVFVPKGDVYITRHCRELTQRSGKALFIVYNSKTNTQTGLHCPKEVFEEVSANAAATALSRKQNVVVKDQKDQANARAAILCLYPRIPLQDVDVVLGHGFAKGTGRVGRTGTLSMDEKVTMAVTAHVRHTHTSYDSILLAQDCRKGTKDGRRKEARAEVRQDQDAVLGSWRDGEDKRK